MHVTFKLFQSSDNENVRNNRIYRRRRKYLARQPKIQATNIHNYLINSGNHKHLPKGVWIIGKSGVAKNEMYKNMNIWIMVVWKNAIGIFENVKWILDFVCVQQNNILNQSETKWNISLWFKNITLMLFVR